VELVLEACATRPSILALALLHRPDAVALGRARLAECAAIVDGFAARPGAGGVAALEDKAGDEAVEDGVVVVAVEGVLEEVAAGERDLLGPELEGDVAAGGVEDAGGGGLRFEVVEGRHCGQITSVL